MPPISYRDPMPIAIQVPLASDLDQDQGIAEAGVELTEDPVAQEVAALRRELGTMRAELVAGQGPSMRAVLDNHVAAEAAKERARIEAEHSSRERAKWADWARVQLGRVFVLLTLGGGYLWGDPDTRGLIERVFRAVTQGEL